MPFLGDGLHVQKIEERRKDIMDYVKAFVVGGIICAIVQILMEKTKYMQLLKIGGKLFPLMLTKQMYCQQELQE